MRVFFIGCVKSSYVFLEALIKAGADVVGVVTKEESKFNADFCDLSPLCKSNNIPVFYTANSKEDDMYNFVKECAPDLAFCLGWSYLIEERVIKLPKFGFVGYHPAELPNNRGRHPIVWALVLGLSETASTFFMIDNTADTGDIVSQKKVNILYEDDAESLMDKLLDIGAKQLKQLYEDFCTGAVKRINQDSSAGNSWRKRGKIDGQIDWRMSSRSIYNLVRALTKPYIGAHFLHGDSEIKVWKVEEIVTNNYENIEPGKILEVSKDYAIVKAGDNLIKLIQYDDVQLIEGEYL